MLRKNLNFVSSLVVALFAISQSAHANLYKADNVIQLNSYLSWSATSGGPGGDGVPLAGDIAIWDSTIQSGANNPPLGADASWLGIQILNPAGLVTIGTNANNLDLGTSGIDMSSASQSLAFNINDLYLDGSQTWNVTNGQTLTIGKYEFRAASYTLTLSGGGTVVFGGQNAQAYLGDLISVGAGVTLKVNANNMMAGGPGLPITVTSGGVVDLNGINIDSGGSSIFNLNGSGISGNGAMINSAATQSTVGQPTVNLQSSSSIGGNVGNIRLDKMIAETTGPNSLTKVGNNTVFLNYNGANAYTGNTIISAGTLALSQGGAALNSASGVSIAAGATFDVHALNGSGSWTAGSTASPGLSASGTGTTAGSTEALIISQSGGIVNLGAQLITLTWGGSASGTDSTHPCLVVSPGQLTLNNNTFTINGPALGAGTYTLISVPGGTISGSPNATPTGTAINGGNGNVISISGGSVILTVTGSSVNPFPTSPGPMVNFSGNTATVSFAGVSGYSYSIQRSTNLTVANWVTVWTTNAPGSGVFTYPDTFGDLGVLPGLAPRTAYYRLVYNP